MLFAVVIPITTLTSAQSISPLSLLATVVLFFILGYPLIRDGYREVMSKDYTSAWAGYTGVLLLLGACMNLYRYMQEYGLSLADVFVFPIAPVTHIGTLMAVLLSIVPVYLWLSASEKEWSHT